jgi:hypothetical protein
MNGEDFAPKSQEEALIIRAAALLKVPIEGMYLQIFDLGRCRTEAGREGSGTEISRPPATTKPRSPTQRKRVNHHD